MPSFVQCILFILLVSPVVQTQSQEVRLLVKKSRFSLEVIRGDSVEHRYDIAIGKNPGNKLKRGDFRTPEGEFVIVQIQNASYWTHDFGDGNGETNGAYGPWFLRLGSGVTEMQWKGIGIHGTLDPTSIGTMASEGCVRVRNEKLEELKRLVKIGTRVTIVP